MLVDTHAFKEAFVQGRTAGFVIADRSSPKTDFGTRPGFAEIYDLRHCYYIFEDRAMAEARLASSVARDSTLARLEIWEVNVESIRDYQLLAGRKTVFLVDREGRTTQSLRVGDMPLAARTQTPFPGPLPPNARLVRSSQTKPPLPRPSATTPDRASADITAPPERIGPRKKPELHGVVSTDPFSHERIDDGENSRDARTQRRSPGSRKPLGWLKGVMRHFFGKD